MSQYACFRFDDNFTFTLMENNITSTAMNLKRHQLHFALLTHWGRVTHICVSNVIIIGSDNGLSPGRRQAIIWTNAEILLIGPVGANFSEILIEILTFSLKKMWLKVSSAKWRPFCLGLNGLIKRVGIKVYMPTLFLMVNWLTNIFEIPNGHCIRSVCNAQWHHFGIIS